MQISGQVFSLYCVAFCFEFENLKQNRKNNFPRPKHFRTFKKRAPVVQLYMLTLLFCRRNVTFQVTGAFNMSFFPLKFAEFDEIMHSDPESLKNIISKVLTWLIRTRWRRAIWGTLSVIKCKSGSVFSRLFQMLFYFYKSYLSVTFHLTMLPV